MPIHPQGVSTLRALLQRLKEESEGFSLFRFQVGATLEQLLTEASDTPLAFDLLAFIDNNLEPLSRGSQEARQEGAARLQQLLDCAEELITAKGDRHPPAVSVLLSDFDWPSPPDFELEPEREQTSPVSVVGENAPTETQPPIAEATDHSAPLLAETTDHSAPLLARIAALVATLEEPLVAAAIAIAEGEAEQWEALRDDYLGLWLPISITAELIGLEPLRQLLEGLTSELHRTTTASEPLAERLVDLPGQLHAWLQQPQEALLIESLTTTATPTASKAEALAAILRQAPSWPADEVSMALEVFTAADVEGMVEEALAQRSPATQEPEERPEEVEEASAEPAEPEPEPEPEPETAPAQQPQPAEAAAERVEEFAEIAAQASGESHELLALLSTGLTECRREMEEVARDLGEADSERWRRNLRHYSTPLERLVMAAETIGFEALQQSTELLLQHLRDLDYPAEAAQRTHWASELERLPGRLLAFLAAPQEDSALLGFYTFFDDNGLLQAYSEAQRIDLLEGLSRGPLDEEEEQETPQLRAVDLALTPDADTDRSVLESVASEGPRLAAELAALLNAVIQGEEVAANLRHAQRVVHTLKGSSNICGIKGIATISHNLEDLLEHLADQGRAPSAEIATLLVEAADALESALEVVFSGEAHDPELFALIAARVVGWAHGIRRGLEQPVEVEIERITPLASEAATSEGASASAPAARATASTSLEVVDALQRQMGELAIALTQAESRIGYARETLDQLVGQHIRNLQQIEVLEDLVDIRGLGTRAHGGYPGTLLTRSAAQGGNYDPLELEEYNEFYITTRRLHEGEADARALTEGLEEALSALEELSQTQTRLSQEVQGVISAARRVPVHQFIPRLQRVIRQTCRATGKQAEMVIEGGDLEVDSEVLERLLPALLHTLRNAVDHGIEEVAQRRAAGKPEIGNLLLRFARVGNAIEVRFSDDGAGLDYSRVRAKAVANGLLAADAEVAERELAMLTLKPGFSTREAVSEISGRGVGMNVVDAAIRELKGALSIESEQGHGYTLTMRLPTSTISMYTLLVSLAGERYAIPGSEIKYAAPFADGEVEEGAHGLRFRYRDESYPLLYLHELLGISRPRNESEHPIVLIAYSDVDERAVVADSLDDSRLVIAKKLGTFTPSVPGISGATVLGDGRIVPILELRRLLRGDEVALFTGGALPLELEPPELPKILIVDDSLSMRKTLSQLVSDGGWQPLTASDGLDALRVIEEQEQPPRVLLVDMEMPRMNGLELTLHLRNDPATRHLPVAMITSRATRSHREKALEAGVNHYFVKPYKEDDILAFIEQSLQASGGERDEDQS